MATLCGFMIPGMRTSRSDELATMLGVCGAAPALDELVASSAFHAIREERVDAGRPAGTRDAQRVEPGRQQLRIELVLFARAAGSPWAWPVRTASAAARYRDASFESQTLRLQPLQARAQVAEQERRTSRRFQSRLLPFDEIAGGAVAGVAASRAGARPPRHPEPVPA